MSKVDELIFDGVDMDDDDAFYEALGVYEDALTLVQVMVDNDKNIN